MLTIAYSPCPNDTFIFHAWAHGLIAGAPELTVRYADIDQTNGWLADARGLDLMKISAAALPEARANGYELLPCGGAMGRGCGPLVLAAPGFDGSLAGRTVAVPSLRSTAFLLFKQWAAARGEDPEIRVMQFRDIMPAVRDGEVDAGLVIHEARFVYRDYGLDAMIDLGEWWERETGLPIPLGAILARRGLDAAALTAVLRQSVEYAWAAPSASRGYVAEHAAEMSPEVQAQHIALYVNEFTRDLGEEGYTAIEALLTRAHAAGLTPSAPKVR